MTNHVAALRETADTKVFKPDTFRKARETMRQAAIYIEALEREKALLTKIGAGALGDLAKAVYPPDEPAVQRFSVSVDDHGCFGGFYEDEKGEWIKAPENRGDEHG